MLIKENSRTLKLSYIHNNYEQEIKEAKQQKLTYEVFLDQLLIKELEQRKINGIERRIRYAKFPCRKYLEDFQKTLYEQDIQEEFENIETLKFIENNENVILIGTPGAGKTHYAISIGIKACMEGLRVMYASVPNLVIELREALSKSSFNLYKKKFEKYDLVILDELGYVSFDKQSCEILFNLLSNRNDNGSVMITTNLTFDRWSEIFQDPMLTGALVDRLAFKAHVLDMSRETSYRLETTVDWKNNMKQER